MITGTVAPSLHPCVPLDVQADDGSFRTVEAVVDSAFTGSLALPEAVVANLGLPWARHVQQMLGDGSVVTLDVHWATVVWDGLARLVEVEAGGPLPLVGTALLRDHDLSVRFRPGGDVVIAAAP